MKEKIGLQDLSVILAEKAEITRKDAETFLREYFEVLNDELINSESIKIKDLGAFKLSQMEDRESIDVTTGGRMLIPAHYRVIFTPDKNLAEAVNAPFAFFETTEIDDESFLEDIKSISDEIPLVEKAPEEIERKIEEPVTEEYPVINKDQEALYWETRRKCHDCHDSVAHKAYRKKYYKARKKIKFLRIIIFILSLLLLSLFGYFVYIFMYLKTLGPTSLSFFKYSIIIN